MVEKWLVQVESMMIQSMKDTTSEALQALATSRRPEWIQHWPGQVNRFFFCIILCKTPKI